MTIPLGQCVERGVYALVSRNLKLGVFNGKNGFIGVRSKFGTRFLDTEYHYDLGAQNFGTARPIELIDTLPDELIPEERGEGYDDLFAWMELRTLYDPGKNRDVFERFRLYRAEQGIVQCVHGTTQQDCMSCLVSQMERQEYAILAYREALQNAFRIMQARKEKS